MEMGEACLFILSATNFMACFYDYASGGSLKRRGRYLQFGGLAENKMPLPTSYLAGR